jgi:hypothetical protein
MLYVLAIAVILLTICIVVLFAMMGELYARLGPAIQPTEPVQEAKLGQSADSWPRELAAVGAAQRGLLIVLSSSCVSCDDVARQLVDDFHPVPEYETAVALTTSDPARAEAFLVRHELPRDKVFVDNGGYWVTDTFGVQSSPSALMLTSGKLTSAMVFTDARTLSEGGRMQGLMTAKP